MSHMKEELYLSIAPFKFDNIPPEEDIIKAGRMIIDESQSWKKGKTFVKGTVQTTSRPKGPKDGAAWYARHSIHTLQDGSFNEFWDGLGKNKAPNESEFIPDLKEVKLLKTLSPTQSIWNLYYRFSPPVSPRLFTVLQVTSLSGPTGSREGLIVSLPIDPDGNSELIDVQDKSVKARYVSAELIKELPQSEGGGIEWTMAVSSTVNGWIPSFVFNGSMPSEISNDVPFFLKWMEKKRKALATVAS